MVTINLVVNSGLCYLNSYYSNQFWNITTLSGDNLMSGVVG